MWRLFGVALVVGGCGGGSMTSDATGGDAVTHDATATDAAPACDPSRPFGAPEPVRYVNTSSIDRWGWLSPDLLRIYFASMGTGSSSVDIYVATRDFPGGLFLGATPLPVVNTTTYREDRPVLTADELTMFLAVSTEIFVATRSSTRSAPTRT